MIYKIIAVITTLTILSGLPLFAKGSGNGLQDKKPDNNTTNKYYGEKLGSKNQNGQSKFDQDRTQDRLQIRNRLKLQINTCLQLSQELMTRTRAKKRTYQDNGIVLQERIQNMIRNNEKLVDSLSYRQKEKVKNQIRTMDMLQTRLEEKLRTKNNLSYKRSAEETKSIYSYMKRVENNLRAMQWILIN